MPASRLIADLDQLIAGLGADAPVSAHLQDELRLTVARVNELRRQLAIAQIKLASVLSLAGMQDIEQLTESGDAYHVSENRFKAGTELDTGIAGIDAAHLAIFQAGNRLYWLLLQRDIGAQEAGAALSGLVQCVSAAFALEERMMQDTAYANIDHHRAIHQRMRDYLSEMQELLTFQPLAVVIKLERFLGSWFLWHMQREDAEFSRCYLREQGATKPEQDDKAVNLLGSEAGHTRAVPALQGRLSSWFAAWREKRQVAQTCRDILAQYRAIVAAQPGISPVDAYKGVVLAQTGCDSSTADMILQHAGESFAEWPVSRSLKLRDVAHYLISIEYLDRYGKDFWLRPEINKLVAAYIPKNL